MRCSPEGHDISEIVRADVGPEVRKARIGKRSGNLGRRKTDPPRRNVDGGPCIREKFVTSEIPPRDGPNVVRERRHQAGVMKWRFSAVLIRGAGRSHSSAMQNS